jgi:hypothetical protein
MPWPQKIAKTAKEADNISFCPSVEFPRGKRGMREFHAFASPFFIF